MILTFFLNSQKLALKGEMPRTSNQFLFIFWA